MRTGNARIRKPMQEGKLREDQKADAGGVKKSNDNPACGKRAVELWRSRDL